jgi:hypothetical protein
MPRTISILAPLLTVAVLTLGLAASAHADVASPEPAEDPPKVQTEPPADNKTETKTDTKSDAKSEKKAEEKSGNCSMVGDGTRNLFSFAALVLLISGTALRRRPT